MYGQLAGGNLHVSGAKGEPPLYSVVFGDQVAQDARRGLSRQILHGPAAIALLRRLEDDLRDIVAVAMAEHGGGAVGLAYMQSDPEYQRLFERQKEIARVLGLINGEAS